MSAYQANVKVEPPCVARSARTPGSIVASSTTSIKIAEKAPPAPCSRMGAMHKTRGTPTTSAVHAFGNEHSGASLNARRSWGAMRQRAEAVPGRSACLREYTETKIIKRQRRLSKCRYISSIYEIYPKNINDDVSTTKKWTPTDFFCYDRKQRKSEMFSSSYTQKYMRAVLPVIKKQDRI